jgi:hypothetical protein
MTDLPSTDPGNPDRITPAEWDRLAQAVTDRFAPHLQAASAVVREAEQNLAQAQEALARAEHAAANVRYSSDRLVFMRVAVREEVDALSRKTTPKKVRASFRYLLARAAELAEGELTGYRADLEAARRDRREGVDACRQAEQRALGEFQAARDLQDRVRDAQQAALDGLAVLSEKMRSDLP